MGENASFHHSYTVILSFTSLCFLFVTLNCFLILPNSLLSTPYYNCVANKLKNYPLTSGLNDTISHTDTHSLSPMNEATTCTTHKKQKRRTSMPSAGFESAIAAIKRPQTDGDPRRSVCEHHCALCSYRLSTEQ